MNGVLKIVLSLSLSGSLLILLLLCCKIFCKNKTSRQWQYYIWLVVIARLLLPFTPEVSVVGTLFQQAEQVILKNESEPGFAPGISVNPASDPAHGPAESAQSNQERNLPAAPTRSMEEIGATVIQYLWLLWLGMALILLIRNITAYQGFVKYIKAGCAEVTDVELLDRLAQIGARAGVKRPVELLTNNLISSPLLLGFFHPCIVFPAVDLPEADFEYTIRHELTHYKRLDMFYKWLVQLTICVHWFNPLVRRMGREIRRACELACDEAVIGPLEESERRAYGDTLLHAMGGTYKNSLASIPLNESAELLKERLGSIMRYKKTSKPAIMLSLVLAGMLTMGAAAAGAYPGPAKAAVNLSVNQGSVHKTGNDSPGSQAERYYKAGSLPLFQIVFPRLSEEEQTAWLERIYKDRDVAFFSAAVRALEEDDPRIASLAEMAYTDGELAFFSTLKDRMEESDLELWLDRALEDGNWMFQSVLFNALDRDSEFDELEEKREKEWETAQQAEYQAAGVTIAGKDYYYQGQLVNVFLDIRSNKSFYTLNMNPKGTINIKMVRDETNKITSVVYLTEAEMVELLGDMYDPDDLPEM